MLMKNFQNMYADQNLPEEDKQKVLQTIKTAKLLMEMADLFTFKQMATNGTVISAFTEKSKKKQPKKTQRNK